MPPGRRETEEQLRVRAFCPLQSCTSVGVLGFELARHVAKSAFAVLTLTALSDLEIVRCVAIPDSIGTWVARELLLGELAHGFEHPISPFPGDNVRVHNQ